MTDLNEKALEAAARAIRNSWKDEANPTDADLAQAAIRAYLSALVQDEATVERVARALCSNPDQIIYRREGPDVFEPLGPRWLVEHAEDARAALSALGKDTQT